MNRYLLRKFSEFEFYFDVIEYNDLQYKVSFSSSPHLLPSNLLYVDLYEIAFTNIGIDKNTDIQISSKIENTINFAVSTFIINNNNCPLVFICDSIDSKHKGRLKLFINWFKRAEEIELYQLIAKQLTSPEHTYFVGLILPITHKRFIELENEFNSPQIFLKKKLIV